MPKQCRHCISYPPFVMANPLPVVPESFDFYHDFDRFISNKEYPFYSAETKSFEWRKISDGYSMVGQFTTRQTSAPEIVVDIELLDEKGALVAKYHSYAWHFCRVCFHFQLNGEWFRARYYDEEEEAIVSQLKPEEIPSKAFNELSIHDHEKYLAERTE